MSVFVVYEKSTGTVVGAVRAVGATLPAAADLVGDALPLRVLLDASSRVTLSMAVADLAVHEADDEPAVFATPLGFGVAQTPNQQLKPALTRLTVLDETLVFDAIGLVVELPGPAPADTAVFALVSEGQQTQRVDSVIKKGDPRVSVPVTVTPGKHGVLVLVAGWAGRLVEVEKK